MEDISEVGFHKYIPDKIVKVSTEESVKNIVKVLWIFVKSLVDYLPYFFYSLIELIFGRKSKTIRGHLALVTGGANGLGKSISIELAKHGCNVVVVDLDIEQANTTAKNISEEYGVKTEAFKCDVSDYESVQQLKKDVEGSIGFIDILVNNAGVLPLMSLREGSEKDLEKIFKVNLLAHFWTCRTFLNGMVKRQRGHIVAIASAASFLCLPRSCAYCASKYAVRGFMNSLQLELYAEGHDDTVKLTTVCPWFIATRQEIGNVLDKFSKFSVKLDPQNTAQKIVEGVLKEREFIALPGIFNIVSKIIEFFPNLLMKCVILNIMKNPKERLMEMDSKL